MKDNGCEGKKKRCRTLMIEGTKYKTYLNKKYETRKFWEKKDEKKIYTFIPGTVVKLYVKKGQSVKKGEPLMLLEAMKMRNIITSPSDGKIRKLNVKEGRKLKKDQLMAEIE